MAPCSKTLCQVCSTDQPKYTCSKCYIAYCSVACFKHHQQSTCGIKSSSQIAVDHKQERSTTNDESSTSIDRDEGPTLPNGLDINKPKPFRPLTSLNWPYVPEESVFPDPLKRDDPKDLQLRQYEAIATSSKIREILNKHENLPNLLTSIDKLRGDEREDALHKALGVTPPDIDDWRKPKGVDEDILALRELAEAVEVAIRGGNETALGLNWEDES
ncbi:hypothetical protein Ac2012v2_004541 [Leucoagaricus gongylophorus]